MKDGSLGCSRWLCRLAKKSHIVGTYPWERALASPKIRGDFPNADTIVVDIKPAAADEIFLCELLNVWGYSSDNWTPLLWHLRVLEPKHGDPRAGHLADFSAVDGGEEVYEFLYARGSVKSGKIVGLGSPRRAARQMVRFCGPTPSSTLRSVSSTLRPAKAERRIDLPRLIGHDSLTSGAEPCYRRREKSGMGAPNSAVTGRV